MKTTAEIKTLFESLSVGDQERLLDELLEDHEQRGAVLTTVREELKAKRKPCPHCQSDRIYKRGKQKGVQMYQCRDCSKWYSETTGTPLWDIKRKDKWQAYLRCMSQGLSIRKCAKEVGISIQTSFDWRHKILSAFSELAPEKLSGEVECDELELPLNQKGSVELDRAPRRRPSDFQRNHSDSAVSTVQVVTAVERGGGRYLKAVESKRLSREQIEQALSDRIEKGSTLITDKHPSWKSYAKGKKTLKHKTVLSTEHVNRRNKQVHLQHVNQVHGQLRQFLMPFHGVSSKYLQNYLNWFAYGDQLKEHRKAVKVWLTTLLLSPAAYNLFWLFKENAVNIRT